LFVLQESGDFTWRVSDCEELVGGTKPLLHYTPLLKTTWSSSTPVKHWQAPHCSTTPLSIIMVSWKVIEYSSSSD